MAFTEFYVRQGVGILDVNGGGPRLGSGGIPVEDESGNSNVAGDEITVVGGGGWGSTQADDRICFDAAGTPEYTMVTGVAGDVLTVSPVVTGSEGGKRVLVGGAWRTVDHALSTVSSTTVNAAGDPPRINLKYSATAYTEYATWDNSGTASIRLTLEGYHTTPGDQCLSGGVRYLPNIDGTGQAGAGSLAGASKSWLVIRNIKCTTPVNGDHAVSLASCHYSIVENVWAKATGTSGKGIVMSGQACTVHNCYVEDSVSIGIDIGNYGCVTNCEVESAGGYGIAVSAASYEAAIIGCLVHDGTDDGIYIGGEGVSIDGNVLYNNAGSGIRLDDPTDERQTASIRNNIFVSNTEYGIEADVAWFGIEDWNAFYNNGAGAADEVLKVPNRGANDVSLAADPFNGAAGGDFSLTAAAQLLLAGFPGTFLSGNSVGNILMGAVQPAGGVSGTRGKHGGKQ